MRSDWTILCSTGSWSPTREIFDEMTTRSQAVRFFEASCDACGHQFAMPALSDFSYGEFILHGGSHGVFGFLSAHDEPAWADIEARSQRIGRLGASPSRTEVARFHRVIAAAADPIGGQRWVPFPVCPSCGSRSVVCEEAERREGDEPRKDIREIPRVTFDTYGRLSDAAKTQRVSELWMQWS